MYEVIGDKYVHLVGIKTSDCIKQSLGGKCCAFPLEGGGGSTPCLCRTAASLSIFCPLDDRVMKNTS